MDANFEEMSTAQLSTAGGHRKQFISLTVLGAEEGDARLRRKKTGRKKEMEQVDDCMEMRREVSNMRVSLMKRDRWD